MVKKRGRREVWQMLGQIKKHMKQMRESERGKKYRGESGEWKRERENPVRIST